MTFEEFARSIDRKYIFCENYDERDAFVDYFGRNGAIPDATMRREMHTKDDTWLYPSYWASDNEIHAYGERYGWWGGDEQIPFSEIADVIYGREQNIVVPELSGLLA